MTTDPLAHVSKELETLGRVTVAWSQLEYDMCFLLAAIIAVKIEVAIPIFYSLIGNKARRDMILMRPVRGWCSTVGIFSDSLEGEVILRGWD